MILTCPLKRDYFNRKYIFQALIFRGHVDFYGDISEFINHIIDPPKSNKDTKNDGLEDVVSPFKHIMATYFVYPW